MRSRSRLTRRWPGLVVVAAMVASAAAASAQSAPSCGTWQQWRIGQDCRRSDGKVCTIVGINSGKLELRNCR